MNRLGQGGESGGCGDGGDVPGTGTVAAALGGEGEQVNCKRALRTIAIVLLLGTELFTLVGALLKR